MTSGIPKTLTLTPIIPSSRLTSICLTTLVIFDACLCFSDLLPREDLIKDGQSVLDASMLWKKGKTFGEVETFSYRAREGQEFVTWHCRVSEHRKEDITFEQLWGKLGKNKVVNEQRWVKNSPLFAIGIQSFPGLNRRSGRRPRSNTFRNLSPFGQYTMPTPHHFLRASLQSIK